MTIMRQESDAREHARWESEHGHWLKDLRIWENKHQVIRHSVDRIIAALNSYDETVEKHAQSIRHHEDVLKMHEDAIAWRREHQKVAHEEQPNIREFENVMHAGEKDAHGKLRALHEDVLQEIDELSTKLQRNI